MKNRITALFLTLALLVCAIPFAVSAAETSGEQVAKPEIVSKNIEYGGNFAMIFAVDSETVTGDVKLEMYDAKNALVDTYNVWKTEDIETASGATYNAYLFRTAGVAAKDMADYYYVKAIDSVGESELVRYSVAEYMYERLLGGAEITANQKALYESVITMGANAQQVLVNDNPDLEDEVLVSEYKYVVLNGAKIDGYSAGVYAKNTELTIVPDAATSAWAVTALGGDELSTISGNTLTVNGHCTVAPYTGISTVYDFEDFTVGELEKTGNNITVNNINVVKVLNSAYNSTVSVKTEISGNVSKVLELVKVKESSHATYGTANGGFGFAFSSEAGANIASYVFEFDMYTNSATAIQVGFGTSGAAMDIAKFDITLSSINATTNKYPIEIANNGGTGTDTLTKSETLTRVDADSWVNYRFEYYPTEGIVLVYINDSLVGTTDYLLKKDGTLPTFATFYTTGSTEGTFYLDNVKVEKSTKTYTAPETE